MIFEVYVVGEVNFLYMIEIIKFREDLFSLNYD